MIRSATEWFSTSYTLLTKKTFLARAGPCKLAEYKNEMGEGLAEYKLLKIGRIQK